MRADYRYFSDNSGYISNILYYDSDWAKADNFLLSEVLYFLTINRKRVGEIGLEGYYSAKRICDEVQRLGYDRDDVLRAINYLLNRHLIIADNFNFSEVSPDQCVKIQAAGFMHLRVLCERIEYLYGLIPVTPIADQQTCARLADYLIRENVRGDISVGEKVRAVEVLLAYLKAEKVRLRDKNPFFDEQKSGAAYILSRIENAVAGYYDHGARFRDDQNELDLI